MNKKGVSPVIATILLIALVVVIGMIIFTWFRSFTQEAITKFDDENIKLVCERVSFEASYSSVTKTLTISNLGNVPIWNFDVKREGFGSFDTVQITDTNMLEKEWQKNGLNQGGIASGMVDVFGYEQITLIPILMGLNPDGERKTETCDERHGKVIPL